MADQKITELTVDETPTGDDLLVTVNNPAGTPANRRSSLTNVFNVFGIDRITADGGTTTATGHLQISQNGNKVIGFGNTGIAFGGFKGSGQGCVKVVADAAGNPGSIVSSFVAPALPGGNPTPWSSVGMNFEYTLTSSGLTIGNPGSHGGDGVAPSGYRFVLFLIQDATGSRTVNWGSDIKFPSGTLPTLTTAANAIDVFEFICRNDIAYCIGQFLDEK